MQRDAMEVWAEEVGIDPQTAAQLAEWALERMDNARVDGVHPVIVMQGAMLLFWMTATACRLPEERARELWEATRRHCRAVAEHIAGDATPGDGHVVAPGLEIVTQ